MGMFDTVICNVPLPMPEDPKGYSGSKSFQTKDLERALHTYEIDSNKQFYIHGRDGYFEKGKKGGKTISEKIGRFVTTKEWKRPIFDTCTIEIYDYTESNKNDYDYWITYKVSIVDGLFDNAELVSFEAVENLKRKKRDEKFQKELDEWYNFTETRRYKYFYLPYVKSVRFFFKQIHKTLQFLQNKTYLIERLLIK